MDEFKQIASTLNFKLSMSNLELYHSNLIATVLEKNRDVPFGLLSQVIDDYEKFKVLKVEREKKHRDLTITFSNGEEVIKVIIENKFKSLPDRKQLLDYVDDSENSYYILLSLTKPCDGVLPEEWRYKSYEDLSEYYNLVKENSNDSLFQLFLADYVTYITAVSSIIKSDILDLDLNQYYLNSKVAEKLREIGLIDLVNKIRYEKMKTLINIDPEFTYSGRGIGDYYFGFTYQLSEKVSFDIQVEGTQYRHKLNIIKNSNDSVKSLEEICNNIKESGIMFKFTDSEFLYKSSRRKKEWNAYNGKNSQSIDIYDYRKIHENVSFEELIKYLNNDLENLIKESSKIKQHFE